MGLTVQKRVDTCRSSQNSAFQMKSSVIPKGIQLKMHTEVKIWAAKVSKWPGQNLLAENVALITTKCKGVHYQKNASVHRIHTA